MKQEYEITGFEKGDFQDPHDNYWCTAVFQGIGEPVKMVVKDPTRFEVGMKVYGEVKEMTSKAGKPYLRFYRENRPDDAQQSFTASPKKEWQPRDDSAIRAQWAINQSREYIQHMLGKEAKLTEILDTAKLFYGMIDQVKGSSESTNPKPSSSLGEQTVTTTTASGYEQAKAQRDALKAKQEVDPMEDAEIASLMERIPY